MLQMLIGLLLILLALIRAATQISSLKEKNKEMRIEIISYKHALNDTAIQLGLDGDIFEQKFIKTRDSMISLLSGEDHDNN